MKKNISRIVITIMILFYSANIRSQVGDNKFVLRSLIGVEICSQSGMSEEAFNEVVKNHIVLNMLNTNIDTGIVFYKITISDNVYGIESDCREFIVGQIDLPPYFFRLNGFVNPDFYGLKQYFKNRLSKKKIRNLYIEDINMKVFMKSIKKSKPYSDNMVICRKIDVF